MLKRAHPPFTPEPATVAHSGVSKKNREYQSPLVNKTPLRNVIKEKGVNVTGGLPSQSPTNASGSPLVNNDDVAERRQHRVALVAQRRQLKKTIMSPAIITPKANPPSGLTPRKNTTPSIGAGNLSTPTAINTQLTTTIAAGGAQQKLTIEQRNRMFEEWMKIAADNKISAKNSWNVALIDYFSELTFLRDGDSINFQKASCTLDGCVKIYSTRVDAVADETGKLLNGLIDGKNFDADPDVPDGIHSGEQTTAASKLITKKRPHKSVDTLAPSFEQLTLKNFDMEFSMDPLFRKTCAEFDDGCTKGFLTSRLGINDEGKLTFDSLDETVTMDEEKEEKAEIDTEISGFLEAFGRELTALNTTVISPSLADYSFKAGVFGADGIIGKVDKRLAETLSKLAAMSVSITDISNGANQMDIVDSDEDVSVNNEAYQGENEILEGDPLAVTSAILQEEVVPFNDDYYDNGDMIAGDEIPSQRNMRNLPLSTFATEQTTFAPSDPRETSFLSYFDSRLQKNWAGPEHWKIQRPHLRRLLVETSDVGATRSTRAAKKDFSLDFHAGGTLLLDHQPLFQRANPATITLSKSILDERSERDTLLPEDLHFSSTSLLQFFLKPTWAITKRFTAALRSSRPTMNVVEEGDRPDLISNEVAPAYWAEVSQEVPGAAANNETTPPDDNDYYNDDYGYEDGGDILEEEVGPATSREVIGDNLVLVARPTLSSAITYARRAKKVDVQELKRVLWREIEMIASASEKLKSKSSKSVISTTKFTQLITDLPTTDFPKDMLKEVSVPYCFICLLHLANEHNLELSTDTQDGDLKVNIPQ